MPTLLGDRNPVKVSNTTPVVSLAHVESYCNRCLGTIYYGDVIVEFLVQYGGTLLYVDCHAECVEIVVSGDDVRRGL